MAVRLRLGIGNIPSSVIPFAIVVVIANDNDNDKNYETKTVLQPLHL